MKLMLLLFALILTLCACKKDDDVIIYPPGTQFNYTTSNHISALQQEHNGSWIIPTNPFTIDSIYPNLLYPQDKYYYCHSSNGNHYEMPESDMKIIK